MTATLLLPEFLDINVKFANKKLTFDQFTRIYHYVDAVEDAEPKIYFDADLFSNITFVPRDDKYVVMALHNDLEFGPEFYINNTEAWIRGLYDKPNLIRDSNILKESVIKYLNDHPELDFSINDLI